MTAKVQNRVKELRAKRGWTQEQLAHAVGVSRQSINSIERQRYEPSLALALTFRGLLQTLVDRGGRSTDFTDFVFGALFGVGIGLVILFVWRMRKATV